MEQTGATEAARTSTATLARSAFGFAAFGVVWSAWTVAAPEVQADFGFDDSDLGAVITALNVFALMLLGVAARTSSRLGSFRTVRVGLVGLAACWAVAGAVGTAWTFVVLVVLGGGWGSGFVEVSLNAAGIDLDRNARRHVLGYLHAAFPAGSLLFVLVGSLAVQLGGGRLVVLVLAAALVIAMCLVWPAADHAGEVAFGERSHGRLRVMRRYPRLVLLAALAAAGLYSEVAVGTWSVVYLRDDLDAAPFLAGAAAASFAVSMLAARLLLPSMLRRMSPLRVVLLSASGLLAAGLLLLTLPYVGIASLAFGLVGLAAGPLVPVAMQLAGAVLPRSVETAAAAVNTLGYVGLIAAPWLVGRLGDVASLRVGLATITVAGLVTLGAAACLLRADPARGTLP